MMTAAQTETPTYAAWVASLPESERHFGVVMPPGERVTYWIIAIAKACLEQKMPDAERWRFSQVLDSQKDVVALEVIAMVQPAGAAELDLFSTASKAAGKPGKSDDDRAAAVAFDVLSSPRMFDLLIAANPSVFKAIQFNVEQKKAGGQVQSAPPPLTETPLPRPPTVMGAAQFAYMQRRSNGTPTQHRSHYPPDQISGMGGGLPDFAYDNERDRT